MIRLTLLSHTDDKILVGSYVVKLLHQAIPQPHSATPTRKSDIGNKLEVILAHKSGESFAAIGQNFHMLLFMNCNNAFDFSTILFKRPNL